MNSIWTQVSLLAYQVHIYIQSKAKIQTNFSSGTIKYAWAIFTSDPGTEGSVFSEEQYKTQVLSLLRSPLKTWQ